MRRPRHSHIFAKEKRGHYVEAAWCARRLFEVEKFSRVIYDPACGWGTITTAARAAGYDEVWGSDIVDRRRHQLGEYFVKEDFLTRQRWHFHGPFSIVCNPPFDHVREFCERAPEIGADKVAMIMLVRRLNAEHWLRRLPLRTVYLLSPRPSMPPGAWIAAGNKPGGGTQDFCWLIIEAGYRGSPQIRWLCRDASSDRGR